MLKRASCDVLILLDCCFAGSAGRENVNGTKELLAACGMEVEAEGVSEYSFTRNLIDKLRSFNTRPFTVSELYERLIKAKRRLCNTPQYIPLTGRDRPSIRIARIEPNVPEIMMNESILPQPRDSSSLSDSAQSSTSIAATSLTSFPSLINNAPRVLLAISLEGNATVPELELWKKWLINDAPSDIRRIDVRIEDAYASNSTLLFISMPVRTWCHLPDTTAYRFVDFITSGSIFKEISHTTRQKPQEPNSISQISKTTPYAYAPLAPWRDEYYTHPPKAKTLKGPWDQSTSFSLSPAYKTSKLRETATGAALQTLKGHDIKASDSIGNDKAPGLEYTSTLQVAAITGDLELVHTLLAAGADINTVDYNGKTALQAAASRGYLEIVERLLAANADVNAPPDKYYGQTALQTATSRGDLEIVERLLAANADVNASPDKAYGQTALQTAASRGYLEIVERLLAANADVNAPGNDGYTALQAAASGGYYEVVERLLEANADVNASANKDYGQTALQAAASGGYLEIVERLLAANADVNAPPGNDGYTALQAAAERGHQQVVQLLISKGAKVYNSSITYKKGR